MSTRTIELVETARLRCERLRPEHARELEPLLLDPRVATTLWPHRQTPTAADLRASLEVRCAHWDLFGFGLWLLRDRATGQMVGRGGLQHTSVGDVDEVEAGWAIVPERWGEGLATELAHEAVELGFGALRLPTIVAFTLPENVASRRVMEKAGFRYERELEHVGLPHVLYRSRRPSS
ncbi:MAG: GNAT family N-acetyltransferase [Solirubrobacterales bacterium]|nr:GNAT family N-acetyltransferase [Solirubrobacterales bacterium]